MARMVLDQRLPGRRFCRPRTRSIVKDDAHEGTPPRTWRRRRTLWAASLEVMERPFVFINLRSEEGCCRSSRGGGGAGACAVADAGGHAPDPHGNVRFGRCVSARTSWLACPIPRWYDLTGFCQAEHAVLGRRRAYCWPLFGVCSRASSISNRSALFTEAESGNARATSGSKSTTFVPSW